MAVVYKCLDTESKTLVALKRVDVAGAEVDERAIRREIDIYHKLLHVECPYLLRVRDVFREGTVYALVTEFADGGTLMDMLRDEDEEGGYKGVDDESARSIAIQVATAVVALHEHDIVHRDIKPQNILKCDELWKLSDFGISKRVDRPVTGYTFRGAHSVNWAPPEQIAGVVAHASADVFAVGRVILFLLTGKEGGGDLAGVRERWRSVMEPCLDLDARKRPAIQKLRDDLEHLSF